ncbi:MAG: carboxyl transferase domain-containing protein [Ilumatobacteraceae bacterium]|nr:carboxyl transferase domain-containing protein [Ilumatobacteraceae bacterium]
MSWQPELDELRRREALAEQLGGADKVERQHHFGKLTVRERVAEIADDGSFWELGKTAGVARYDDQGNLVEFTPSNFVFGIAELDGRPVVLSGDDFTVRGGSNDASISAKREASESIAAEMRLPHVRLLDGMSGGGSVKTIEQAGRTYIPVLPGWHVVVDHLNIAPSVSLVLGSVAGFGAARAVASHYSVMVRDTSQMMIAGPALVEQAGLGSVSKEELGHADVHTTNGAIDDAVASEAEAFERASQFLSYLPTSVDELPPIDDWGDDPARREPRLADLVPRNPRQSYDMRSLMSLVVDDGSFFEIGRDWGTSVIGGLARLDGIPVAVFGENPMMYGGGWTAASCRKLTRLIDLASMFKLPMVHFEDCPGFLIGKQSEQDATVRYGTEVLVALREAQMPYCTVVIRKAFGIAGAANRKPGSESMRMAWPSGDWGSLPLEGGLEVAYKAELAASDAPDELKAQITERLNRLRSPHRSAEFYEIEQIIDPLDTRPMLCDWARLARRSLTPSAPSWGYRP